MVKKIIIIIGVSTQGARTKRKVNKMKKNETLYTLTAFIRVETTYSPYTTYNTRTFQFIGLNGFYSAMECAMESVNTLSSQYSKEHIYYMRVRKTVIFR